MGGRILGFALGIALVMSACGARSGPRVSPIPPVTIAPIPSDALPGAAAAPAVIDITTLSADAVDVAGLRELLQDSNFVAGTQRVFSRVQHGRRRLLARVLDFGAPSGADAYLAWIGAHAADVIGRAGPREGLGIPHGSVYEHEPNPCCHNDTRIFLAAWSHGSTVLTLEVGGPGARASDVAPLVERLDAAV